MRFARIRLMTGVALGALAVTILAACASATPLAQPSQPAAPTQPPAPTAVPTNLPAPTAAPATSASANTAPAQPVTIQLAKNDKLGAFLADGNGNTLYLFMKDTADTSNCYDKCLAAWPALLSQAAPTLKDGVNAALLGTTQRKDGSMQITYNHHPLYYYAADHAAGDTNGQAVGKVWWVGSGEGNPIKPAGLQAVQNDKFGKFLADDAGMSLYIFAKDSKNTTVCYDKCEQSWPPLLTLDQPQLGAGVDASMVGTLQRKDGTRQVTFNGQPLYYYFKDKQPGDTTGQNVGDVWFLVAPDATAIKVSQ